MYNEQISQDLTRKRLQDTNILLQAMRRMLKSKQAKHLIPKGIPAVESHF